MKPEYEIILEIKECKFRHDERLPDMEGFSIKTNKKTIYLGIQMETCCCENPGYFMSEDNFMEYIGAQLLYVDVVDKALNSVILNHDSEITSLDEGGVMFVNINTNKGTLQFVAYNAHNGYYGHSSYLITDESNVMEIIHEANL